MIVAAAMGTTALVISPLAIVLIVILVEHRPFAFSDQYLSFIIGDTFLAAGVLAGFLARGSRDLFSWWIIIALVLGLLFGWFQSKHELKMGIYSFGESRSPSKLWHQYICYPFLSMLVLQAFLLSWNHWVEFFVLIFTTLVWFTANVWDQSHPKAPHRDFHWHNNKGTPT